MSCFSQRVKRNDLEVGAHIYSWRTHAAAYSHHGIHIGKGKVIHFTHVSDSNRSSPPADLGIRRCPCFSPRAGVKISCLDCFVGDGLLCHYVYGVSLIGLYARVQSGTCTIAESDAPQDVIHRANYLLRTNMFGEYDVLQNNCEHFALYCKTGHLVLSFEGCGRSGKASSAVNVPKAAVLCLVLRRFVPGPAVVAASLANRVYGKYAADIGVRDDAHIVKVEDLANVVQFLPSP